MKHQTTSPDEPRSAQLIGQPSTSGKIDTVTLDLLAAWRTEDATNDAEQIRAAKDELAEFKPAMNKGRFR
jgi:hypothetical protein